MPTELSDNEIIQQVLGGNQQVYSQLVTRYQSYVFTLALRMLKTREDAEEVAQDVFVKAYRSLADFRGLRRERIVPHSQIKRPDQAGYHGGYEEEHEGYAKPEVPLASTERR